jgi:hypothetical protein
MNVIVAIDEDVGQEARPMQARLVPLRSGWWLATASGYSS